MTMHEERFTGRVREYVRFRARYPEALVPWLQRTCGLDRTWCVADVGAGTGMLAEEFLRNGNAVVAVEPNAEMRAECEGMRERWPRLEMVDGTAERTGLHAASVEMVSVGRAFHWFDPAEAELEFRRILKPGGWVALVSSGRERGAETTQGTAFQELLERYGTDAAHVRSWGLRAEKTAEFLRRIGGGVEAQRTEFVTERGAGWEEFVGETQSLSVAPLMGAAGFAEMQEALRAFFAEWSVGGVLRWDAVCGVSVGRVV